VILNPPRVPDHVLLKWNSAHPVLSVDAAKASLDLHRIQGKRGLWFCGAYQGYGFHEDGLKVGTIYRFFFYFYVYSHSFTMKYIHATYVLGAGRESRSSRFAGEDKRMPFEEPETDGSVMDRGWCTASSNEISQSVHIHRQLDVSSPSVRCP
jgi:hypothetical protein